MKEEELVKKLENVVLPDIKLQSHQRRLRMALLVTSYLQGQQRITTLELVNSKLKAGKDTMIRGLISRQPIWKVAVVGMVALALIISLILSTPNFSTNSAYATDIVEKSSEVQEILCDGEVELVKVIVIDEKAIVIAKSEKVVIKTQVDLKTKKVTEVDIIAEPTAIEKHEAIDIATADPRVKELLNTGAMISKVSPMFYYGIMNLETGEVEEISETFVKVIIARTDVNICVAYVDLNEGRVVKLIDPSYLKKRATSNGKDLQEKLAAMVEKGELTQEQADEKLEFYQSVKKE
ncbi:hypothetical protein ACFLTP_00860 [Chloroflexota bacterium]